MSTLPPELIVTMPDLKATAFLGQRIAILLKPGDVIALSGDLGAGKTTLARAIIAALGYEGDVPSPTFSLLETYTPPMTRLALVHADFYRLNGPEDLEELGLDDVRDDAVLIAEWPERIGGFSHESACLAIRLEAAGPGRRATIRPGKAWVDRTDWTAMVSDDQDGLLDLDKARDQDDTREGEREGALARFVAHSGWGDAAHRPLAGDASFRRYIRLHRADGHTAMLMDAPPPREDVRPFLAVAQWLETHRLRSPRVLALDEVAGFVLLEDLGDRRMRDHLDGAPLDEAFAYEGAVDTLVRLASLPCGPWRAYDLVEYLREARLFIEWFCVEAKLDVDFAGWESAWSSVLTSLLVCAPPPVTVLRDYHAENIMLLDAEQRDGEPPSSTSLFSAPQFSAPRFNVQGLLDFQDALAGHPAYDLVSLLQDARRDVSPDLEEAMVVRFLAATGYEESNFRRDYAILGAQRNTKIIGIFVRLWRRDSKRRYLSLIPRVWALLERDLDHSALAPVAQWFDANIPSAIRAAGGAL